MKNNKLFFIAVFFFTLFSCEKVIDIDLNEDQERIVVEGSLYDGDTTHRVKITKTLNFDQSNNFPTVNDAVVSVADNLGNVGTFASVGNGWYELTSYPGVPGRTYTLTVVQNGKTYTATSLMPTKVIMDEIVVDDFAFGVTVFKTITAIRQDPAGERNYYLFESKKNDTVIPGINLQDDQFNDGSLTLQPILFDEYISGDSIDITMFMIDKTIYDYFNQLATNTNGQGATPANPISNFNNGCLGYFSARTVHKALVVIP